jgi:glutathione S-transferase
MERSAIWRRSAAASFVVVGEHPVTENAMTEPATHWAPSLRLYYHPLASFCWKVLIALYENDTPFQAHLVDLANAASRESLKRLWPIGKFPVLLDEGRGRTVPESSVIIEYLEEHCPGARPLLPPDRELRLETRLWDRFFDAYVHAPMQKIVVDHLRPVGEKDPRGVDDAHATLRTAYAMLDERMRTRTWILGEAFSMADCAAAPALFYSGIVAPYSGDSPHIAAYFDRLTERSSFARTIAQARPYFPLFPLKDAIPTRFVTGSD